MTILEEKAYAKLNLTLDVLGKRSDGYHDLRGVMQAISLCDDLELTVGTGEPWQVTCDRKDLPAGQENLAFKAAKAYFDASGTDPDGLSIRITKRIPAGGGLGGGSADAAAVLRALNRYENNRFTLEELEKIGLSVGCDVPFMVRNHTSLAEGRGEVLTKVPAMPQCFYVLVNPGFSVSTAELFGRFDAVPVPKRPNHREMEAALKEGNLQKIGKNLHNVLEFAVLQDHPELFQIENALDNCGALGTSMTGSGSVMFGMFETFDFAATASMSLMQVGYETYLATNV